MDILKTEASVDNLSEVIEFVEDKLISSGCPSGVMMQIDVALEEIFVNVASYAYASGKGMAQIEVETSTDDGGCVTITVDDSGAMFDPLAKADPDITLSAEERGIGGLGIFMVKKSMDDVSYEYKDGHNRFTMFKRYNSAGK